MTKKELKKEAEEYTKNLLKRLGIKEDMLLENQPKYLRQESMNFVALDVENVTDAYLASAEPREKRIAELEVDNAFYKRACEGATMMYKHLTKAKEIIKKLIEAIHIWDCKNLEQVEAEAEQFLSEVEK